VGEFEDFQDFRARSDDAEFAAALLHVAVEDHNDAEACAVEEFDAGEIENKPLNAVADGVADLGFDLAQAHAEGHASVEAGDCGGWVDVFQLGFKNHGAGFSSMPAKDIAGLAAMSGISENRCWLSLFPRGLNHA
jgi:hypothetical protein